MSNDTTPLLHDLYTWLQLLPIEVIGLAALLLTSNAPGKNNLSPRSLKQTYTGS